MEIIPVPLTAVGITLYRIVRGNLVACEDVQFELGPRSVELTLRRASICGRVEVGGKLDDYFADLFNASGDIVETVALDRWSYSAMKTRLMRCRVAREQVG